MLAVKKKLGLHDIRIDIPHINERQPSDFEVPGSVAIPGFISPPVPCDAGNGSGSGADVELLVKSVTDAVMKAITTK